MVEVNRALKTIKQLYLALLNLKKREFNNNNDNNNNNNNNPNMNKINKKDK